MWKRLREIEFDFSHPSGSKEIDMIFKKSNRAILELPLARPAHQDSSRLAPSLLVLGVAAIAIALSASGCGGYSSKSSSKTEVPNQVIFDDSPTVTGGDPNSSGATTK